MAIRKAYSQPQAGAYASARIKKVLGGSFSINASDVVAANSVSIAMIPAGFVLQSISGTIPKLDTGATLTINVGDAAVPARLVSASTVAQAGGPVPALIAGAVGFQYTIDTEILLGFVAAPVGGQAGIGTFYLEGFMANP
jgi:hypothetical protein